MKLPNTLQLGCNYKALEANWAADATYFKSIGLTNIRPHLNSIPDNFTPPGSLSGTGYEYWRRCATFFARQGFWVSWGPSSPSGQSGLNLTEDTWQAFRLNVLADATYMQAQGIALGCYELGNEQEAHVDGVTLTQAQFIAHTATLATEVKAIYTLSPIGYSMYDTGGTTHDNWIANGMGGLDFLGLHPYSNIQQGGRGITDGGYPAIIKMMKAFGADKLWISEFGLEASDTNLNLFSRQFQTNSMRYYWNYMRALGFTRAQIYMFVGWLNGNNAFACRYTDGSYVPYWDVCVRDGGRRANITF